MFVLAHAASAVQAVLYLAPLVVLVAVLVRTKIKDRRDGDTADEEEIEPTLDEVMDDSR